MKDEIDKRQEDIVNKAYEVFKQKRWFVIMTILRILTAMAIVIIAYYFIAEINAVKVLANDPCELCLQKLNESNFLQRICYPDPSVYLTGGS